MTFAFPALFIVALALPGIILRYSYSFWAWRIRVIRGALAEEIGTSLFSSLILHLVWCQLAFSLGYKIDFKDVLILLTGGAGLPASTLETECSKIAESLGPAALYFVSLYVGSIV